MDSISGWRTKILHDTQHDQKIKEKETIITTNSDGDQREFQTSKHRPGLLHELQEVGSLRGKTLSEMQVRKLRHYTALLRAQEKRAGMQRSSESHRLKRKLAP